MHRRVEIEAIVACSAHNFAIGKENTLPFKLPKDMERFKTLTMGHAVVMGTKTARSIKRALPGRTNYVVTRSGKAPYKNQIAVASLQEVINWELATKPRTKIFVIGGEEIYTLFMPYYTGLHLTMVNQRIEGADAFWPEACFRNVFDTRRLRKHHPTSVEEDGGITTFYTYFSLPTLAGPPLLSIPPLKETAEVL